MPRILIVDDHADTRETFSALLRCDGYESGTAEDGRAGISQALAGSFDAILVDLHLPDMSGVDVVRELRARGLTIPMVVMTAFPDFDSSFEAGGAGATRYVEGPLMGDEVSSVVREALESSSRQRDPVIAGPTQDGVESAFGHGGPVVRDARIRSIMRAIESDPAMSLDNLASHFGLSESRLRHLFADLAKVPISDFIRDVRLALAARLIRSAPESMKQISQRIGVGDFRKAFRTRFGMSPQAYRRRFRRTLWPLVASRSRK
jgi:DNA-binding response OmpR family regulator